MSDRTGAELIAAERQRQIEAEGWTPEHDDEHRDGDLHRAAIVYAAEPYHADLRHLWPWDGAWFKPSTDPVRDLVKAGSLYLAESERLIRRNGPNSYAAIEARRVADGIAAEIDRMQLGGAS